MWAGSAAKLRRSARSGDVPEAPSRRDGADARPRPGARCLLGGLSDGSAAHHHGAVLHGSRQRGRARKRCRRPLGPGRPCCSRGSAGASFPTYRSKTTSLPDASCAFPSGIGSGTRRCAASHWSRRTAGIARSAQRAAGSSTGSDHPMPCRSRFPSFTGGGPSIEQYSGARQLHRMIRSSRSRLSRFLGPSRAGKAGHVASAHARDSHVRPRRRPPVRRPANRGLSSCASPSGRRRLWWPHQGPDPSAGLTEPARPAWPLQQDYACRRSEASAGGGTDEGRRWSRQGWPS